MHAFEIGSSFNARFDGEAKLLATIGRQRVALWDVARRRRIGTAPPFPHASSLDLTPDGRTLAVKNTAGEVLVLRVPELVEIAQYRGPGEGARIRFAPGGDRLVDASWAGSLVVRDAATGNVVWHELGDGIFRLGCTRDRSVWIHDRSGGSEPRIVVRRWPFDEHAAESLPAVESGLALALSDDGRRAAVFNGGLVVLERDSGWDERARIDRLPLSGTDHTLTWIAGGEQLVYTGGRRIRVFDPDLRELASHKVDQHVCDVDFADTLVALGDWSDGVVLPWPLEVQAA